MEIKLFISFILTLLSILPNCKSEVVKSRSKRSAMPTKEEQQIIVDRHNKLRAELGNDVDKEPMPANMRYMTWDDGLAYTSMQYAYDCKWEHSEKSERRGPVLKFDNGENLWSGSGIMAMEFDPINAIDKWFIEYEFYEFENQTCVPGELCGHYTQVVWAQSYKIGCAWHVCSSMKNLPPKTNEIMFFVCQYAPGGNVDGVHPYLVGPRCSECAAADYCWENALCRKKSRDELIPFTPPMNIGSVVAGIFLVLLVVGIGGAYYLHSQGKLGSMLEAVGARKKRKVSTTDGTDNPPKQNGKENGTKNTTLPVENSNGVDS